MFLHIKVVEAVDIPKMDILSKSDPYCIISLSNSVNRQRTKTIKNTDHPVWNQEFHLPIKNNSSKDNNSSQITLSITVYDEDTFSKDDLISSIEVPLNDYAVGRVFDEWYSLYPAKKVKEGGRIHLVVHVAPKDAKPFQSTPVNMMSQSMINYNMMNPGMMNPNMMSQNMMNPNMMNPNMMNPSMMNPNMGYNYNAQSQLPHLTTQQSQIINQKSQYLQQQPMTTPYPPPPQMVAPNPYLQQQQMQRMQQIQRSQQMQRMQAFQQNPYMAAQNQYSYNFSNMNNNMMYGAVPPPNPNVYPTVVPSQLPRISNQSNAF